MKYLAITWMLLFSILTLGCNVDSLQPLYTAETLAYEPALIGSWQITGEDADQIIYSISDNGEGGYNLLFETGNSITYYTMHLVRLGNLLFADTYPSPSPEQLEQLEGAIDYEAAVSYLGDTAVLHEVYLIKQIEPTLIVTILSEEWANDADKANLANIAHAYKDNDPVTIFGTPEDDTVILTATTEELQRFYIACADNPEAWDEDTELVRIK